MAEKTPRENHNHLQTRSPKGKRRFPRGLRTGLLSHRKASPQGHEGDAWERSAGRLTAQTAAPQGPTTSRQVGVARRPSAPCSRHVLAASVQVLPGGRDLNPERESLGHSARSRIPGTACNTAFACVCHSWVFTPLASENGNKANRRSENSLIILVPSRWTHSPCEPRRSLLCSPNAGLRSAHFAIKDSRKYSQKNSLC